MDTRDWEDILVGCCRLPDLSPLPTKDSRAQVSFGAQFYSSNLDKTFKQKAVLPAPWATAHRGFSPCLSEYWKEDTSFTSTPYSRGNCKNLSPSCSSLPTSSLRPLSKTWPLSSWVWYQTRVAGPRAPACKGADHLVTTSVLDNFFFSYERTADIPRDLI